MDLTRCNLGKFLAVHSFFARRLQVRQDARAPSGESWNYFSRRLSCNIKELTLPGHLGICSLLQIYNKWTSNTISLCVFKA